eukprot:2155582-Pyramimonas_sp.AAC.1
MPSPMNHTVKVLGEVNSDVSRDFSADGVSLLSAAPTNESLGSHMLTAMLKSKVTVLTRLNLHNLCFHVEVKSKRSLNVLVLVNSAISAFVVVIILTKHKHHVAIACNGRYPSKVNMTLHGSYPGQIYVVHQSAFQRTLSPQESRKLAERLINYVLFKAVFVGAVVEPDMLELALWAILFASLGYLK